MRNYDEQYNFLHIGYPCDEYREKHITDLQFIGLSMRLMRTLEERALFISKNRMYGNFLLKRNTGKRVFLTTDLRV